MEELQPGIKNGTSGMPYLMFPERSDEKDLCQKGLCQKWKA